MLKRPTIKPHLRVTRVEGAGVFVLSELRQVILQGRLFELVTPHLDGRPVEQVCQQLAGKATPAQIFYTITALEKKGYLCESDAVSQSTDAAVWTMQDIQPGDAADRLARTTVTVTGLGVDVAPLCEMLEELGVRVGPSGQLDVVLANHYLHKGLRAINRQALDSGRPWILVKPLGLVAWIGPLFEPRKTACWECLAQRIRANFPVLGYLESLLGEEGLPETDGVQTPATLKAALGLAATTVANWISRDGDLSYLSGKLQTVNLITLQSQSHPVIRQPACAACGQVQDTEQQLPPLVLESRMKSYTEDGGHRSASPQETLDKYGHHISPISGAVTMLERLSPDDDGVMHVFISGNNIARGPESLFNLKIDLRNMSCGKGINEVQAKASALCEGLERYSGIHRGDEPRRVARFIDLGTDAIHPNACMRFSDKQYAERDERNARASVYNFIPMPFDPEAEIEWTPAWSLTHETARYLPMALCYFNYPQRCDRNFCSSCSNGNAAGNSFEEAILQGFLELVERDAVGIWWYNRVRVPGIDLDSFEEPYLDRLRAFLKKRHRDLWALDLTSDLGIPAFAALSHRTDSPREHIMFGFGAHLDPRIALLRAITELNQMIVPLLDVPPDGPIPRLNDDETVRWVQSATLANEPYLVPREGPLRAAADYAHTWTDDLYEDIRICRSVVEKRGLEVLVLDQTRPEIKMPVVKVLVPGLRHFWMRFAPGRLYDVPVKLGWLDKPCDESALNPIPMFL
jgi:bacteriocin biosynthesis cyclodehydratase domain-containing protein